MKTYEDLVKDLARIVKQDYLIQFKKSIDVCTDEYIKEMLLEKYEKLENGITQILKSDEEI
jgi:hypothetical protein